MNAYWITCKIYDLGSASRSRTLYNTHMSRIAIIHYPTSNHASTWAAWLESADLQIDTIYDEDSFKNFKSIKYDLVIPLITISDYVNKNNARVRAMTYFSALGLYLLTPPAAIAMDSRVGFKG